MADCKAQHVQGLGKTSFGYNAGGLGYIIQRFRAETQNSELM